jgi:hypothetical protein
MKLDTSLAKNLVVTIVLIVLTLLAWSPKLDKPAMEYVDAGMKNALVSFATARALNAAISLVQGTQVSLSLGVGVTVSIGEVLDPINDLVENFSELMLLAAIAFGIEKFLLMLGQYYLIKWILTALVVAWVILTFSGNRQYRWLNGLIVMLLLVRFAVPVATLGSDVIYAQFLDQQYQQNQQALDSASIKVKQVTPDKLTQNSQADGCGVLNPSKCYDAAKGKLTELKEIVDKATEHIIQVIVVFLLQTLVLPLLMLFLIYLTLKQTLPRPTK